MNPRVLLLIGSLLGSAAWAQSPGSFDLSSNAIKEIVHARAAAQSVAVQESQKATTRKETGSKTVVFVPPEKPPRMRNLPTLTPPAPKLSPLLSAVVDIAVDELLNIEPDPVYDFAYEKWRNCQQRNADRTSTQRNEACSGAQPPGL